PAAAANSYPSSRPLSPPMTCSPWKISSPSTGTLTQSVEGAAAYGTPDGIEPLSTIASPRAASQRASAPTVARTAQEPAPNATASQVRREVGGALATPRASASKAQ